MTMFDEMESEWQDLEDFENWSRHTMVVPIVPKPDLELNFICDDCHAPVGVRCADDCEYQKLKKQLGYRV